MDREDYEISKGQLALLIGGAVSKFVNDTETENLTINVEVDRPTATFDETGKRCGNCCWFKFEDIDGWGNCYEGNDNEPVYCGAMPCRNYVSQQQCRHYLAILIQHNRWRRDDHVPNYHKMVNPTELGKAIDWAINYIKTFMEL